MHLKDQAQKSDFQSTPPRPADRNHLAQERGSAMKRITSFILCLCIALATLSAGISAIESPRKEDILKNLTQNATISQPIETRRKSSLLL